MAIKLVTLPAVVIASGGTAQQVSSDHIPVTSLTLQAEDDNTGDMYIGDSTVTTDTGLYLPPGATAEITGDAVGRGGTEEFYLDEIYALSSTTNDTVRAAAFKRRG